MVVEVGDDDLSLLSGRARAASAVDDLHVDMLGIKVLGATDGAALVIGTSIGVGIYATPSIIAGYLGTFPLVISLWLAVGLFVMIGCFIYAELGTRLPETGGE